jgi:hypothetical protein
MDELTAFIKARLDEDEAAAFEGAYAARSGVTVEFLHRHGRYAERCDCGEPECGGWAMGHQQEDAITEDQRRAGAPRPG